MNPLLLLLVLILLSSDEGNSNIERIAGGEKAKKGQFPFFAQLYFDIEINKTYDGFMICGASLIHPEWILSAGHCFKPPQSSNIRKISVYMGTNLRLASDADVNTIKHFTIHENYREVNEPLPNGTMVQVGARNDIAVGQLQRPYAMYKYVRIAYLPPPNIGAIITRCKIGTIVGIGMTNPDDENEYDTHVLYAVAKSMTKNELFTDLNITIPNKFYSEAKWLHGHPLKGDSGSPFVCYINKKPVVYGILSSVMTTNLNYTTHVSLYEKVDTQMKFIINTIPSARMQIVDLNEQGKVVTGKSSDTTIISTYCFIITVFLIMHVM